MTLRRLCLIVLGMTACAASEADRTVAFVGARLIDGTGRLPIDDAVIVVRAGRVAEVGTASSVRIPTGAARVEFGGRFIVPGFINTHGHVGRTAEADSGAALRAALLRDLTLYAQYGVTTVNSLGGDGPESVRLRNEQDTSSLARARIFVAGTVVTGDTPAEVRDVVDRNADMDVDMIKIRVDDNLGTAVKMSPAAFVAAIDQSHRRGRRLAAHVFYLNDGKALLESGADFIAHSVRDKAVDNEFIDLLTERGVCYSPTLTREVSTFVYETVPTFFSDPFFLAYADSNVIRELSAPTRRESVRTSSSAQRYKTALEVAKANVKRVADGGGTIALGTDTGPFGRFQGYFEHLEMALMAEAGLSPLQILVAATGDAARCLELDELGTIEPGKWADFVVLREDPLVDIANSRTIESVWIAGNMVER